MQTIGQRNEEIARRYYEGESGPSLSSEFNLHESTINKIYHGSPYASLPRLAKPRTRKMDQKLALSPLHNQIGNDLSYYRVMVVNQSLTDFANRVRMSRIRLTELEKGLYDVTLAELHRISEVTGITIEALIRKRTHGEQSPFLSVKAVA